MIRGLSIIIHLPLIIVLIPGNLSIFFENLIPIVMFDFLQNDEGIDASMVLEFDEEAQIENQVYLLDQMENLGYNTHNCIQNLGTIVFLILVYSFEVFICLILVRALAKYYEGKPRTVYESLLSKLFFAEIITIVLEGYFELLISGTLNLRRPLYSTKGEMISNGFAFVMLALAAILFLLNVFVLI
jgi:hypothetical protein